MFGKLGRLSGFIFTLSLLIIFAADVYADAAPTATVDQTALRLNEFMASNTSIAADPSQPTLFPDWVEIYNPGADKVSLDGLFITNSSSKPTRVALPSGLAIEPNSFLVLYADFSPSLGPQHVDLSFAKDSGYIGLYANQGNTLIDSIKYKLQYTDVSEGRSPDGVGQWRYLTQSTPNSVNAPVTPFIRDIHRTPIVPTADVSVTVTALITDNGTMQATLFYNPAGGGSQSIPMLGEAAMISGTNFTAQIPPQPDGTLVRYYVTAQDNDNLQDTTPRGAPDHAFAYQVGYQPPKLYINEIMADNGVVKFPGDTATPDWIEIYNPGPNSVDLSEYYLTTDNLSPRMFDIPAGQTIPAGGFLVFFADKTPTKGPLHTNFTLKEGSGGFLGLYDELSGSFTDSIQFGAQGPNISYARFPDGSDTWQMTSCYSPGQSNNGCTTGTLIPRAYLPLIQK
jgi:hypothetical protein